MRGPDADSVDELLGPGHDVRCQPAVEDAVGEEDVFQGVELGQEIVELEDEAEVRLRKQARASSPR